GAAWTDASGPGVFGSRNPLSRLPGARAGAPPLLRLDAGFRAAVKRGPAGSESGGLAGGRRRAGRVHQSSQCRTFVIFGTRARLAECIVVLNDIHGRAFQAQDGREKAVCRLSQVLRHFRACPSRSRLPPVQSVPERLGRNPRTGTSRVRHGERFLSPVTTP